MKHTLNVGVQTVFAMIVLGLPLVASSADVFPQKPIKIVVPAAPGGGVDTLTRVIAPALSEALGQQVVADNRPGAGTMIASELVAKSPSDGYTLLMATSSFSINPAFYEEVPYDPSRDFLPITLVAVTPFSLVVHPSQPVTSVMQLVALAKSRPDQINFGSSGNGSSLHLAGELFRSLAKIALVHVPYKGGTPAVTALLEGEVQLLFNNILSVLPHVQTGRLRMLAVTSAKRTAILPAMPTMIEAGIPGYEFSVWWGLLAPKGTSAAIADRIRTDTLKVIVLPTIREELRKLGVEVIGSTPEAFSAVISGDLKRFRAIVQKPGGWSESR
jgi:tripartite-type tricarboxylate transporter receptor subunit TctC